MKKTFINIDSRIFYFNLIKKNILTTSICISQTSIMFDTIDSSLCWKIYFYMCVRNHSSQLCHCCETYNQQIVEQKDNTPSNELFIFSTWKSTFHCFLYIPYMNIQYIIHIHIYLLDYISTPRSPLTIASSSSLFENSKISTAHR